MKKGRARRWRVAPVVTDCGVLAYASFSYVTVAAQCLQYLALDPLWLFKVTSRSKGPL